MYKRRPEGLLHWYERQLFASSIHQYSTSWSVLRSLTVIQGWLGLSIPLIISSDDPATVFHSYVMGCKVYDVFYDLFAEGGLNHMCLTVSPHASSLLHKTTPLSLSSLAAL